MKYCSAYISIEHDHQNIETLMFPWTLSTTSFSIAPVSVNQLIFAL